MQSDTDSFYDAIAEFYPLFFKDWETQLEREGLSLKSIFRNKGIERVLDSACGVGTQAIPLAELGFNVVATDPSIGMLKKAMQNAETRGLDIDFRRADFSQLPDVVEGPFDAVICKGNTLPHLITDEAIETTLLTFYELLRPGGLLVVGMRDFEPFMEHRPRFIPGFDHRDDDENEFITFDIWEWEDGPPIIATQNLFMIRGKGDRYETIKRKVTFRPLSTDELQVVLLEVGYEDIEQHPDRREEVLVARKPLGK